jgi:hypothetical protein
MGSTAALISMSGTLEFSRRDRNPELGLYVNKIIGEKY